MNYLKYVGVQFKSPLIGRPSRPVEAHYNGRAVKVSDGERDQMVFLNKKEIAFEATEQEILTAAEKKIDESNEQKV